MSNKSPLNQDVGLVTYKIKIEGSPIKDTYELMSIKIDRCVNKISKASLVFNDGFVHNQKFPISDSKDFLPGNKIEIQLGYKNKEDKVFEGIVISQKLKINNNNSFLRIECRDKAVVMTKSKKNKLFKESKDSDAISKIIKENGLQDKVDATKVTHPELIQYYSTDWDFVLNRALFNGLLIFTNNGKMEVGSPDFSKEPIFDIEYGDSILEFDARINTIEQFDSVESLSWNFGKQEIDKGLSKEPKSSNQGKLTGVKLAQSMKHKKYLQHTGSTTDKSELEVWSNTTLERQRLSKIIGHVSFQGSAQVLPFEILNLVGVGEQFQGKVFVTRVVHQVEEGEWITTAYFGIEEDLYMPLTKSNSQMSSELLHGIHGLHIAKVIKIIDDPLNQNRVQIKLPLLEPDVQYVWARLSQFTASNDFGAFFYPEIDDEVIVAFLNNDPRYPIILGSLYSSQLKPAEKSDEKNTFKSIKTSCGHKITFDDDKKILTLETPTKNMIVFSDDEEAIKISDQHSNEILMDKDGIKLDSSKDIKLTAKGKISLSAGAAIQLEAKADVTVSGNNISNSAEIGFTAKGNATAELSASGNTTVKGAMVMIN